MRTVLRLICLASLVILPMACSSGDEPASATSGTSSSAQTGGAGGQGATTGAGTTGAGGSASSTGGGGGCGPNQAPEHQCACTCAGKKVVQSEYCSAVAGQPCEGAGGAGGQPVYVDCVDTTACESI